MRQELGHPTLVQVEASEIIMCGSRPGQPAWGVEAMGQLGMGSAGNYQPIIQFIQHNMGLEDMVGGWHM
jgi:hypothetical protein